MRHAPAELARRAAQLENPAYGLAAVAALRERLAALEAIHVQNAREAGLSWQRIATVLGVSKQALHKKHAKLLRPRRRERVAVEPGQRHLVVTGRARSVGRYARQEARALGHTLVGTGHLLLGILRLRDDPAAEVLRANGLSLALARAVVDRIAGATVAAVDGDARRAIPVSRAARRALEQSLHEAVRLDDVELRPVHVLLGVLREEEGVAARVLQAAGRTADEVEAALLEALGRRNVRPAA